MPEAKFEVDRKEPFVFRNRQVAYTIEELFLLCQQWPEDAIYHLTNGHFEPWLSYIGQENLATNATKARQLSVDDKNKLQNFIKSYTLTSEAEQQIVDQIVGKFKDARKGKFTFLLVGRTGVGKSSTINALLGRQEAKIGKFRPMTTTTKAYEAEAQGIRYVVVDTPGLADTSGNEQEYLKSIKSEVKEIDCMFYVSLLNENRIRDDEAATIRLVSQAFSVQVWERAILVFTHADKVDRDEYSESLVERTKIVQEEIAKHIHKDTANAIPSVAVANDPKSGNPLLTPDGRPWLGQLYVAVFKRISDKGMLPFLLATADRVKTESTYNSTYSNYSSSANTEFSPAPIILDEKQKEEVRTSVQKNIDFADVVLLTSVGASIGAVFGPVGAVAGGVLGAATGVVSWLFSKR